MTITRYHPLEKQLWVVLQARFDKGFAEALRGAADIVEERSVLYDNEKPMWHRVSLPWGAIQEVSKKMARSESKLTREDVDVAEIIEDFEDSINYLAGAISFMKMLTAYPGVDLERALTPPDANINGVPDRLFPTRFSGEVGS